MNNNIYTCNCNENILHVYMGDISALWYTNINKGPYDGFVSNNINIIAIPKSNTSVLTVIERLRKVHTCIMMWFTITI